MSPCSRKRLVKKLVVLATVVGLGSSLAFLLVACGGEPLSRAQRAADLEDAAGSPDQAPTPGSTSVWTGKELIVSGRRRSRPRPDGTFIVSPSNVAASYDPASNLAQLPRAADRPELLPPRRRLDRQRDGRFGACSPVGVRPADEHVADAAASPRPGKGSPPGPAVS